jgi:hypothetical protein
MRTIPTNQYDESHGDFPVDCDFCGVPWMRSEMRLTDDGRLACPDESGLEAFECVEANRMLEHQPRVESKRDLGSTPWYAQESTAAPSPAEIEVPNVVAWWKAGEGLEGDESGFESWTDQVSGRVFEVTAGAPTVTAPDALGGYRVFSLTGSAGDRIDVAGALSTWSCLHDGSGGALAIAFRSTVAGALNIIRTTTNVIPGNNGMFTYQDSSLNLHAGAHEGSSYQVNTVTQKQGIALNSLTVLAFGLKRFRKPYEFELLAFNSGSMSAYRRGQMAFRPETGTLPNAALHIGTPSSNAITGDVCEIAVCNDFGASSELFNLCQYFSAKFRKSTSPI